MVEQDDSSKRETFLTADEQFLSSYENMKNKT